MFRLFVLISMNFVVLVLSDDQTLSVPYDVMDFILGCRKTNTLTDTYTKVPVIQTKIARNDLNTVSRTLTLMELDELDDHLKDKVTPDTIINNVLQNLKEKQSTHRSAPTEPSFDMGQFSERLSMTLMNNNYILLDTLNSLISYKLALFKSDIDQLFENRMKKVHRKLNLLLENLDIKGSDLEDTDSTDSGVDVTDSVEVTESPIDLTTTESYFSIEDESDENMTQEIIRNNEFRNANIDDVTLLLEKIGVPKKYANEKLPNSFRTTLSQMSHKEETLDEFTPTSQDKLTVSKASPIVATKSTLKSENQDIEDKPILENEEKQDEDDKPPTHKDDTTSLVLTTPNFVSSPPVKVTTIEKSTPTLNTPSAISNTRPDTSILKSPSDVSTPSNEDPINKQDRLPGGNARFNDKIHKLDSIEDDEKDLPIAPIPDIATKNVHTQYTRPIIENLSKRSQLFKRFVLSRRRGVYN